MGSATYDFDGETAIVTGGSSGIGRQIALRLGEAGASVVVADIREDPVDRDEDTPTHEVLEDGGERAMYVETDVSDPTQVEAAVERAREYGGVDVMVNNAGTASTIPLVEVTPESFEAVHSVNTVGAMFGCKYAAVDMLDRGETGSIVNMASIRAEFAHPNQIEYDATKGAIRMVTRAAAYEFADRGIRVNAVAPGPIATSGRSDRQDDEIRADVAAGRYVKPIPMSRAGEPPEVAAAVVWLASEESSYTTGELLFVDGGYQIY